VFQNLQGGMKIDSGRQYGGFYYLDDGRLYSGFATISSSDTPLQ